MSHRVLVKTGYLLDKSASKIYNEWGYTVDDLKAFPD